MALRQPADYEQALERIAELEQELESLDALLLLREHSTSDTGPATPSPTSHANSAPTTCSATELAERR
jgi:hypothetical protein